MKATNFLALAAAISFFIGLVSSLGDTRRCPTKVYSHGLQKALDAFSKSGRCFVKVRNDFDTSITLAERCNAAVPGSVASNQRIRAKGVFVNKLRFIVCEIQPEIGEIDDDDLKAEPVSDVSEQDMDGWIFPCRIKKNRPKEQCRRHRAELLAKFGDPVKGAAMIRERRIAIQASIKQNETLYVMLAIIGTLVIMVVIFGVLYYITCSKKALRANGLTTTTGGNTTTKSKKQKTSKTAADGTETSDTHTKTSQTTMGTKGSKTQGTQATQATKASTKASNTKASTTKASTTMSKASKRSKTKG